MTRLAESFPTSRRMGRSISAEIDRNWTQSRSVGASLQAVDTDKIFGHDNTLTVGASLDYGWTRFNGNSQLGTFFNDNNTSFPIIPYPYMIDEPDSFLAPVSVHANNIYTGLYALDTFSATDRLTLTGGGRFNFAGINLDGASGALLNGYSSFYHINPTVGLTYKITPDINFYAGYAMSNRAPTPLELGCADPTHPCIIDNFLVSDPKLQQVVGQTFEVGFRGQDALSQSGPQWGKLQWSAGLFRTTLANDILPLQSAVNWLRLFRQCRDDLAPGGGGSAPSGPATGGRPTPTTPISTRSISRRSWSRRRSIRWPTRTVSFRSQMGRRSRAFQRIR